ncbi:hypothetical protein F7218_07175 [Helicobacter pylori]|uniref:Uncharacterized protein n=1 Tax=Helicobacter pylori TaxID=210 RepID=A0A7K1P1Q5_HELPX|nr:hypothetical protein [Helicobacter pylori]TPH74656.1 hypothetical protein FIM54_07595 [Helicobacter pylori]
MRTSYARYKCMVVLYYKLVAFIPNTKDVWDFCLGGLNLDYYLYPLIFLFEYFLYLFPDI